jgi:hypothetical protein
MHFLDLALERLRLRHGFGETHLVLLIQFMQKAERQQELYFK